MDAKDVKNGEVDRVSQLAKAQDALESFLSALESSKPPEWDALPDIGLYMDQVINYLERQIGSLFPPNKEGAITSSMINNYVKAHIIPRAQSKKYSQEHIALLLAAFVLKKALTTQDMGVLLAKGEDSAIDDPYRSFYEHYRGTLLECGKTVAQEIRATLEEEPFGGDSLRPLALKLAVEASIRSLAAEMLLTLLEPMAH
ncbi:MAG TPA: DUF1836 domain-containing protein [Rectinema sp.]|nr:DUF1836 domain-containing protein [Rectinema sp.]HQE69198.1 DUF1836 domain-containing protein [Rectinema sp.]